jgi:hypothetical protein
MSFDVEKRRKKDRAEAIIVRRQAADLVQSAIDALDKANRKLQYNKSDDIRLKIIMLTGELKEVCERLSDPENDPE